MLKVIDLLQQYLNEDPVSRDELKKMYPRPGQAETMSFSRINYQTMRYKMQYSAGRPIEEVRETVLGLFNDIALDIEAFNRSYKLRELDAYAHIMEYCGLALLYNVPSAIPTVAMLIAKDPKEGIDPLVHTLFTRLGIASLPGKGAELIRPKPFAYLMEASEGVPAKREKALQNYLKNWYRNMKGCAWHDIHKRNFPNHCGYWSFESAIFVALDNLDDSSFRDMNFYPRDLLDYSREHGWVDAFKKAVAEGKTAMQLNPGGN